jgi:hypothetical protein
MLTPYVADNEAANTSGDTVHYDTPQRAMITACAIGATVLQFLDQTISNVALPYMQGSFSSSFDEITWVLGARLMKRRRWRSPPR